MTIKYVKNGFKDFKYENIRLKYLQLVENNIHIHDFNFTQTYSENEKGENILKHMVRVLTLKINLIPEF